MSKLLLKNIRSLVGVHESTPSALRGNDLKTLPCLEEAWLACDNGRIADFGTMDEFPGIEDWKDLKVLDCNGRLVLPAFCDSHTHLVYAGSREGEFVDRLHGLSYEQVAARGGGILNSVDRLRRASEDELFHQAHERLEEIIRQGTGAVEIKTGYGLSIESELKMLRVIARLKELARIPVKATFLGAHAVPVEFKGNAKGYLDHVVNEMLPAIAAEGLAEYIDIFCERNYFDSADTEKVLEAGAKFGMKGRVHAEQLSHSGGISAGVKCNAISVDHLEFCSDEDIRLLAASSVIPTILPGAAFFLNLQYPPARQMIDAGLPVAIASDFNPGTCPTGNMKLMMSIACVQYKLSPEEAINAATINGAAAMDLQHEVGSITRGKLANLVITREAPGYGFLPYAFGSDLVQDMVLNGILQ